MIDNRGLILLILCCLASTNAYAADMPSVAGGLVPKGAIRELPPWIEIGRNGDDPANFWIGLDEKQRLALPGVTKVKLVSPENWLPFYGLRLNLKIPKLPSYCNTINVSGRTEGYYHLSSPIRLSVIH